MFIWIHISLDFSKVARRRKVDLTHSPSFAVSWSKERLFSVQVSRRSATFLRSCPPESATFGAPGWGGFDWNGAPKKPPKKPPKNVGLLGKTTGFLGSHILRRSIFYGGWTIKNWGRRWALGGSLVLPMRLFVQRPRSFMFGGASFYIFLWRL